MHRHFTIRADANDTVDALRVKMVTAHEKAVAIQAKADEEKRSLTTEEQTEIRACSDLFDSLQAEIAQREKLEAQQAHVQALRPRQTAPQVTGGEDRAARRPFASLGDFARVVKMANPRSGLPMDPRLVATAPADNASESVNEDGGFLVPPDFRASLVQRVFGEDTLMARTDQVPTNVNQITFPVDETAPWAAGGVNAAWTSEGAQYTPTKPAPQELTVRAHKLTAIVPATDELMADAPSFAAYASRKVGEVFDFEINDAIINGTGIGRPKGLLNSACKVEVAAEGGQTASTVNYQNITKMWQRLYAPLRSNAVWLINQDVERELQVMTAPTASGTSIMPYLEAGGINNPGGGLLYGKPVIPVESCQALGTAGDIILTNLKQYLMLTKGGLRSDVSIHLWFDYGITAFRFDMRVGGVSWWSSALTRNNSALTASPIITLADR